MTPYTELCERVKSVIQKTTESFKDYATLEIIDIYQNRDIALEYNIKGCPEVYFNKKCVLTSYQASDFISNIDEINDQSLPKVNEKALYNYLVNELISANIELNSES